MKISNANTSYGTSFRTPIPPSSCSPTLTIMCSFCGKIDEDGINARGEGTGGDREDAPLRGGSIVALGTCAVPNIASGPCVRGVAGTVEFLEYAGYAGVVGGVVVPPPLPIKAS